MTEATVSGAVETQRVASEGERKKWEAPSFEQYDVSRETKGKFATTTEYSPTTGPAS